MVLHSLNTFLIRIKRSPKGFAEFPMNQLKFFYTNFEVNFLIYTFCITNFCISFLLLISGINIIRTSHQKVSIVRKQKDENTSFILYKNFKIQRC